MGRHWKDREYVSAEWFGNWIEQQREWLDRLMEDDKIQSCEIYKIMILSKLEALDVVSKFLHEEQEPLGTILAIQGVSTIRDNEIS